MLWLIIYYFSVLVKKKKKKLYCITVVEALCCKSFKPFISQDCTILCCTLRIFSRHCGWGGPDILELLLSDRAAYTLSPYKHWWKEMFNERFGKCGYKSNLHSLVHALGINQLFKWHAAPNPPSDPTVKKVADKLASFVAKNGRQFEHITRQKNPGDTPFKYESESLWFLCVW